MKSRDYHLHSSKGGSALTVRITPRARKNEIAEILNDGTIRIRLTESSSEDKLNPALINFLAGILEIQPESIEIVAGNTGKDKLITIFNLDAKSVQQKILAQL